jgi:hypothetical protein
LVFHVSPSNGYRLLNQSGTYNDYEVCALFTSKVPADSNAWVAVNFWGSDNDNTYSAGILPAQGKFEVDRVQKGKILTPVSARSNPAIARGTDVTNEISVTVNGNKGTLAINGQKAIEFTGSPPDGGSQFGFWVSGDKKDTGPSTLTLKNVQLRELEKTQP